MREIISIHIGQAGIQSGNTCWELFCLEHGIDLNGKPAKEIKGVNPALKLFCEQDNNKFEPRSLFVDTDSDIINEVRYKSKMQDLYQTEQFVTGKEDTSGNFASGYHKHGKEIIGQTLDKLRKMAEKCSDLEGFIIYNSVGGGTGSGFGSLLNENISNEYTEKLKFGFTIFPSDHISNNIISPYNTILAAHHLLEHSSANVVFDNSALYTICNSKLNIEHPTYNNMNEIISQVVSSLTASIRFEGTGNLYPNLTELITNLIPYPRLHFMISSLSPIIPTSKKNQEIISVFNITNSLFDKKNLMVNCETKYGKFMALNIHYRGDAIPKEINASIAKVKKMGIIQFVDWGCSYIRCSANYYNSNQLIGSKLAILSQGACMVSNSTSIAVFFERVAYQFDLMYRKRAFLHWFVGEGMEELQFQEAREDIANLKLDYDEVNCYMYDY